MSHYLLSPHEQGTPGWFADRAGRVTGSKAEAVCAQGRGTGEATTRRNYRYQLACERLTGRPVVDDYTNAHMERGREFEAVARAAYEAATGRTVTLAGFAHWPDLPIGCSVDGFVEGGAGIVEIKCPLPAIHVEYLEANRVPPAYVKQVLHNMLVTGATFCDFVSYNKELPAELQLFVYREERAWAADLLKAYESQLRTFLRDVDDLVQHLNGLTNIRRLNAIATSRHEDATVR
jgi:putative phage-type endonuclease